MHIRDYKPDQSFRGSIDTMDEIEDFKTYVAEYFSWKVPRHGEEVFTDLDDAEEFLFEMYAEEGMLTRTGALELKAEMLSEIQAVVALHGTVRLLIFRLDMEWLQRVRARLRVTRRPR